MTPPREHDIVLFGATGFTGTLTAHYLARNAPPTTRWALAGRDLRKLQQLRDQLDVDVSIIVADINEPDSLTNLAKSTRCLVTTVGPYLRYGHALVAACAEAGTDYLDLTGEPEFVDLTYLRHHEQATRTGARIIHACGFDSIPHDLGALFTVQHLSSEEPISLSGYVSGSGMFSGGTFDSAITALSRSRSAQKARADRHRIEPKPATRRVRAVTGNPGHSSTAGGWVLPLPTVDPDIVVRSAAALPDYGPDFQYRHFAAFTHLHNALAVTVGVAGVALGAQLAPTRALLRTLRPAGSGPDPQRRTNSWFRVRFLGETAQERVVTEVSGGDPGYDETAKMLAESALCLTHDDLPSMAGQVTTAVAMGDALRIRLEKAGIAFRLVED